MTSLCASRSLRPLVMATVLSVAGSSLAQSSGSTAAEAPAPSAAIQAGTFGMSASLFGGGSGSVGLLYFLSGASALHIDFSTVLGIAPAGFSFGLGVGYRMYMAKAGQVSLFVEPGARIGIDTNNQLSLNVGAGAGLEYFISDRLSIGATAALTLRTSNRFQNVSIDTSTSSLFLHLFF